MTVTERIQISLFGAIIMVGLPALLFAAVLIAG
jgi:hypothetical protein